MVSMRMQRHTRLSASPRLVRHERDDAPRIVQFVVDSTEPALMAVASLSDQRAGRKLHANLRRHGKVVVPTSIIRLRLLPAPTSLPGIWGHQAPFFMATYMSQRPRAALRLVPRTRLSWCRRNTAPRGMAKTAVPSSGPALWSAGA